MGFRKAWWDIEVLEVKFGVWVAFAQSRQLKQIIVRG